MNINRQQRNWLLDSGLWLGFLALFFLELTGVELHQWLGAGLGFLAGLHLVWHWKWVKAVTQRFFGKTTLQARVYYLLDAGILLGLLAILVSGLAISTWLDLTLTSYPAWVSFHLSTSIATLVLVVVKIGLHWRWIVKTAQDLFRRGPETGAVPTLQPVRVSSRAGRRHFIKLMGVVALSAGAAFLNTRIQDTGAVEDTQTASLGSLVENLSQNSGTSAQSNSSTTATTCTVRCKRGCSFPGHCRRYVDSDRNGKCDLGECV